MSKRVLLAEDEPNIVESLSFLLQRAGYDVVVEIDGRKALDNALNETPDVMILDVMLPEMDGYEVLRKIRADDRAKSIPVLMLTAKGQREDRRVAMECGADLFITKPFANAELVAAVEQLAGNQTV
ncbi:MAG: response regulator [Alphaproteobacteria bacterium]